MEKGTALLTSLFSLLLLSLVSIMTLRFGEITFKSVSVFNPVLAHMSSVIAGTQEKICEERADLGLSIPVKRTFCRLTPANTAFPLLDLRTTGKLVNCKGKTSDLDLSSLTADTEAVVSSRTCKDAVGLTEDLTLNGNLLSASSLNVRSNKIKIHGSVFVPELALENDLVLLAAGTIRIRNVKRIGGERKLILVSATGSVNVVSIDNGIEVKALGWLGVRAPRFLPLLTQDIEFVRDGLGVGIYVD